jgi:hypothetical protein
MMSNMIALADLVGTHVITGWSMFTVGEGLSASDWVVNDIKIGNNSQFAMSGDMPGDMFATSAIDSFLHLEPVQVNQDLQMTVTYVGSLTEGAPFHAAVIGMVLEGPGLAAGRHVLPMSSNNTPIPPGQSAQITARPQNVAFRPERIQIAGAAVQHHLILRIDEVLHDFVKGGSVTPSNEDEADLDVLDPPLVIEIRSFGAGPMLWGLDERTGAVVLEIGSIVHTEEATRHAWIEDDDDAEVPYNEEDEVPPGHTVTRVEKVERREHFCRFAPKGFTPTWWALLEAGA